MSLPVFCEACAARVEWHLTTAGRQIPIDPDPHADGAFYFGPGLKLARGSLGLRPRMYRCHWDTCPKGNAASKRGLKGQRSDNDTCARFDCERDPDDGHRHCFVCGSTQHFAGDDCPEGS